MTRNIFIYIYIYLFIKGSSYHVHHVSPFSLTCSLFVTLIGVRNEHPAYRANPRVKHTESMDAIGNHIFEMSDAATKCMKAKASSGKGARRNFQRRRQRHLLKLGEV